MKLKLTLGAVLVAAFVALHAVPASAHHGDGNWSAECSDDGSTITYSYSVTYPNEDWSHGAGQAHLVSNRLTFSPATLTAGATATAGETTAWDAPTPATIVVTITWDNGNQAGVTLTPTKPDDCEPAPTTTTTVPETTPETTTTTTVPETTTTTPPDTTTSTVQVGVPVPPYFEFSGDCGHQVVQLINPTGETVMFSVTFDGDPPGVHYVEPSTTKTVQLPTTFESVMVISPAGAMEWKTIEQQCVEPTTTTEPPATSTVAPNTPIVGVPLTPDAPAPPAEEPVLPETGGTANLAIGAGVVLVAGVILFGVARRKAHS